MEIVPGRRGWLGLLLVLVLGWPPAFAAGILLPRDPARIIDLNAFAGRTYLEAVLATNEGINAKTLADYTKAVTISSPSRMVAEIASFKPKVRVNLFGYFKEGQAGFETLAGQLAGQSYAPEEIQAAIWPYLTNTQGLAYEAKVTAAELILLTSGSGTVVEIDADDYFYNVSYQTPKTSSGRTYAVTATRPLLDPSDRDYLGELGGYLTSAGPGESSNFYTAIFDVLTKCDSAGIAALNPTGQVVATDFLGIYTAELMRHEMVNLVVTNAAWEIDIAEVTLLSAYVTAAGMVLEAGKLMGGSPEAYSSHGSIGTHEADFIKLARLITAYENAKGTHKATITTLKKLTPMKGKEATTAVKGDIFRQALVYLDQPQFASGVRTNAAAITERMGQLLSQIRTDQSAITAYVLKHQ